MKTTIDPGPESGTHQVLDEKGNAANTLAFGTFLETQESLRHTRGLSTHDLLPPLGMSSPGSFSGHSPGWRMAVRGSGSPG